MNMPTDVYQPAHFAARKTEINLIQKKPSTLRSATGDQRLLVEFFGVPGLGKSWLLHHLKETLQSASVITALADFAESNQREYIIGKLLAQVRKQIPNIDQKSAPSVESLVQLITAQTDSRVFLLLFDTSEKSSKLIDWLEDQLVYPLLRTGRVVFVFAGRYWLRWKSFEVRRRVDLVELKPFDRDHDTPEQLEKLGVDTALSQVLYPYSFGHPHATRAILDALKKENLAITAETLNEHQNMICEAIYQKVIQGRLFQDVRDDLKPLLELTCIPRRFDVTPLKEFAGRFYPDKDYKDREGGDYLDIIHEMQDTTLVQWNSDWEGYILLPVLRWIMAKNLSMRDPERFKRWHTEAAAQYQEWIERYPRNAVGFLIEWAFHRAWGLRAEGQTEEQIGATVVREVKEKWAEIKAKPDVQWDLAEMTEKLKAKVRGDQDFKEFFSTLHGQIIQWSEQLDS